MKRTSLIIILSLLLTSCNHFGERWDCIWIQNDSHTKIIALFDLEHSRDSISDNFVHQPVDPLSSDAIEVEGWEKNGVKDSVYLYFLNYEILFGDNPRWYYLESKDIMDEAIIARIPYKYKDLYDINSSNRSRITIYFPPLENSNDPVYYYNGYCAEDFE